jgi:hypothetical protein
MRVSRVHFTSLYYKERRQLKTFLTQFGPALPLMSDPLVRLHDDKKRWNDHRIAIWGAFLKKRTNVFATRAHPLTSHMNGHTTAVGHRLRCVTFPACRHSPSLCDLPLSSQSATLPPRVAASCSPTWHRNPSTTKSSCHITPALLCNPSRSELPPPPELWVEVTTSQERTDGRLSTHPSLPYAPVAGKSCSPPPPCHCCLRVDARERTDGRTAANPSFLPYATATCKACTTGLSHHATVT